MLKIREWLRRRNKSKELQILAQNLNYLSLMRRKNQQEIEPIFGEHFGAPGLHFSGRIFEILFVFSLKLTTYRLKLIRFWFKPMVISIPNTLKTSWKDNRRFFRKCSTPSSNRKLSVKSIEIIVWNSWIEEVHCSYHQFVFHITMKGKIKFLKFLDR